MEYVNKFIYGGEVKFDISNDTVTPSTLLKGYTAHGADGAPVNGACEYDVDSSEATAAKSEILKGKTAAVRGQILTGDMPNNGAVAGKISTKDGKYIVAMGYHDGSGGVEIDSTEKAKLIASNIREGVTILGVEGTMSGSEDVKAQTKTATPTVSQQSVVPDSGYTHLTEVVVAAIPYTETANAAGGITITIG